CPDTRGSSWDVPRGARMSHAETGSRQEGIAPPGVTPAGRAFPGPSADLTWRVASVLLLAGLVIHAYLLKSGSDFQVFWLAGWRVLSGILPYDLGDGAMPFKYAPPIALLLVPLAWLPEHLAYLLWLLLSAVALLRLVRWSQLAVGSGPDARAEALVLLGLTPLIAHLFALGQCDALLLWALAESEHRRRTAPLRSGALWALACLVKPPFLLLAVLVAWRGESRRADGFLLGLILMFGAVAAVLGPAAAVDQVRAWVDLLRSTTPGAL